MQKAVTESKDASINNVTRRGIRDRLTSLMGAHHFIKLLQISVHSAKSYNLKYMLRLTPIG